MFDSKVVTKEKKNFSEGLSLRPRMLRLANSTLVAQKPLHRPTER